MGVSFTWKPTDPSHGNSWGSGSGLHKALETAFGGFPMTLTTKDIQKLEGIAACGFEDVQALIDSIHECDSVDVEAHW